MKRLLVLTFLLIAALILQSTLLNFFEVVSVKPDLLLVIVLLYGLLYGKSAGILGFCYGLIEDLLLGRFIGFNAFNKGLAGFIVGYLEPKFFKEHALVPVIVLLIGTIGYGLISFIVGLLVGLFSGHDFQAYARIIIIQAIYNACLAPLVYARYYNLSMQRFLKKLWR